MPEQFLTPSQLEQLDDGWHTAIVFSVGDFDVLYYALMHGDADRDTKAIWEKIQRQFGQKRFLRKVGDIVNRMATE